MAFYIPEVTEFEEARRVLRKTRRAWRITALYLEHATTAGSAPAIIDEFSALSKATYKDFLKAKGHYDTLRR